MEKPKPLVVVMIVELFCNICGDEVEEHKAPICMASRVHGQIEEVVFAHKALSVDFPKELTLDVFQGDVAHHDRCATT